MDNTHRPTLFQHIFTEEFENPGDCKQLEDLLFLLFWISSKIWYIFRSPRKNSNRVFILQKEVVRLISNATFRDYWHPLIIRQNLLTQPCFHIYNPLIEIRNPSHTLTQTSTFRITTPEYISLQNFQGLLSPSHYKVKIVDPALYLHIQRPNLNSKTQETLWHKHQLTELQHQNSRTY